MSTLSSTSPSHQHQQQQSNDILTIPEHRPNGESHDLHMTDSSCLEEGVGQCKDVRSGSYDMALLQDPMLMDDNFYNFGESVINPSNSFFDGSVPTEFLVPDKEFDADLFDSILSSGDDILAGFDKNSGSGKVASFGLDVGGGTGEEEDRAESNTPTNASRSEGNVQC